MGLLRLLQEDDPKYGENSEALKKELGYWEVYLSNSKYVAGDVLTLADLSLGPFLMFLDRHGATFKDFPKLAAYIATLKVGCYALALTLSSVRTHACMHMRMHAFLRKRGKAACNC